jgi:RES domain-containing protein
MASRPDAPRRAYRIADGRNPIFDGTGAMLYGGRWNSPGRRVIYAAETYAGALLEVLVHTNTGRVPKHHAWVEIAIPNDTPVETCDPSAVPGWDHADLVASRAFGDAWYDSLRSAILSVPSVVTRHERNLLIHQDHPDFARILCSPPAPVQWDSRLIIR